MRPGLAIVGLFAVLLLTYALFQGSLGTVGRSLLQASLVLIILAGAVWFRYHRGQKGWFFFSNDDDEEDGEGSDDDQASSDDDNPDSDQIRKAS